MNNTIFRSLGAALDLLLPRKCIVCGCRLNLSERHLCLSCASDIPLTYFWSRTHNEMADRFNALVRSGSYSYAAALFFYRSDTGYRQIPYQLKYHGNTDVGKIFGSMLGKRLAGCAHWSDVDMVIPVPLHRTRLWKRGYNQAEIIAKAVASETGARVRTDILVRHRRTKTQTILDVEEKVRNVAGAFSVRKGAAETLEGIRHILIVDDVFTTGSTLMACFTALRTVFPPGVRISVATLAFVGEM